jgi:hypothetical protein
MRWKSQILLRALLLGSVVVQSILLFFFHQKMALIVPKDFINFPQRNETIFESTRRARKQESPKIVLEETFSGCLQIMDDNSFLVEWLAFHYEFLPLRRLIVAVDPKSKTSPVHILERYRGRGLMNISIWYDEDYFDLESTIAELKKSPRPKVRRMIPYYTHRGRQKTFYSACMKQLHSEKASWTALLDTDEFVVPNWYADKDVLIRQVEPTVFRMLAAPENRNISTNMSSPCIPMHRLPMRVKEEENLTIANDKVPSGFNYTDFFTMRWRYPGNRRKLMTGKAMVDLSRVNASDISTETVNPHRPLYQICTFDNIWIPNHRAAFCVQEYVGTWEQWSYRDDSMRNKRTREMYLNLSKLNSFGAAGDDSARFWLEQFVDRFGSELAHELLQDAGRLVV